VRIYSVSLIGREEGRGGERESHDIGKVKLSVRSREISLREGNSFACNDSATFDI